MIYLDNNATTRPDPRVLEAMRPFLESAWGNPASSHRAGREARAGMERARAQVAALLGGRDEEIVFTSGGTESINTAVRGALVAQPKRRRMVLSAIEHSATKVLAEQLSRGGVEVTVVPVDAGGQPDLDFYGDALGPDVAVVSMLWANNETGVVFPVAEMAAMARARGIPFHVDAVQAAGKVALQPLPEGVAMLSLSGHKFHGPKGTGALFVARGLGLPPLLAGGGQEGGRRSGTENVAGIAGLGLAAELAREALPEMCGRVAACRDAFEAGLTSVFPEVRIHGDRLRRLPNTTNFAVPGLDAPAAALLLDEVGVACSVGSACSSGHPQASHVLQAMGISPAEARSSLRFSWSRMNHPEDGPEALRLLAGVVAKCQAAGARNVV